jgi:hypothetical protein
MEVIGRRSQSSSDRKFVKGVRGDLQSFGSSGRAKNKHCRTHARLIILFEHK